jgi:hypothetical protein
MSWWHSSEAMLTLVKPGILPKLKVRFQSGSHGIAEDILMVMKSQDTSKHIHQVRATVFSPSPFFQIFTIEKLRK